MIRSAARAAVAAKSLATWLAICVALLASAVGSAKAQPVAESKSRLDVIVLGSGGPGATGRAGSAYLVLLDGMPRILVDAGPGSFVRIGEAGVPLTAIDTILLTHLHADHAGELPGIVKALAVSRRSRIQLRVFGPDGRAADESHAAFPSTRRLIDLLFGPAGAFGYLANFSAPVSFATMDIATQRAGAPPVVQSIVNEGGLTVRAIAGHHRDAPSVIYRIDYAGRSVTFTGDIDAKGHAALRRIASGTDLLVFNSVVLDPPLSPEILYTLHTPPGEIGAIAADAHVERLLLSHLSPATDEHRDAVRESIARRFAVPVEFASDGARITP
ncbi:MAG TPA: MBL fold metallo-hydrolase [Burkholderiaceae bacterium]|nr:MBL fold metallo-hydrolase [Burkholderiaceae bacterium]